MILNLLMNQKSELPGYSMPSLKQSYRVSSNTGPNGISLAGLVACDFSGDLDQYC